MLIELATHFQTGSLNSTTSLRSFYKGEKLWPELWGDFPQLQNVLDTFAMSYGRISFPLHPLTAQRDEKRMEEDIGSHIWAFPPSSPNPGQG